MNVAKPLIYLSPSSFKEWKLCPWKFFLKRLSGHLVKGSQGTPAALGCSFDLYIKRYLARQLGFQDEPRLSLATLVTSVNEDIPNRVEILEAGKNLAEKYIELGFARRLLEEGLKDIELEIFEQFEEFNILGKPDASLLPSSVEGKRELFVPLDWKVRGYGSKLGYSPTPGYRYRIDNTGKHYETHAKSTEPLEMLNPDWADQLAIYGWLLNPWVINNLIDMPIAIDEVTYGRSSVSFTSIRSYVSKEYQTRLKKELKECWNTAMEPVAPIPSKSKCEIYNMLCDAAVFCTPYQETLGNPEYSILR